MTLSIKRILSTSARVTKNLLLADIRPKRWGQVESLKSIGRRWLKYSRGVAYTSIVANTLYSQPFTGKATYASARFLGLTPKPVSSSTQDVDKEQCPFDSFVANYDGFDAVESILQRENIQRRDLDLNGNNIAGDTREEVQKLIDELKARDEAKYEKEIKLLQEIFIVSQIIWGQNEPNPSNVNQGSDGLCQLSPDIQGYLLTPENIQKIKKMLIVTGFEEDNDYKKPNAIVKFRGKIIDVPYNALEKWVSTHKKYPLHSNDDSLGITILAYAILKGMEPYGGIPNYYYAAPSTLISGDDYCSVPISTLSDEDLIRILRKAPETLTKVSVDIRFKDLNREIVRDYWANVFTRRSKADHSETNVQNLRTTTTMLEQKIYSANVSSSPIALPKPEASKGTNANKPTELDSNRNASADRPTRTKGTVDDIMLNHIYVVKELKEVDGKYVVTIMDSNDYEIDLSLQDLKEHITRVISKNENFPNITTENKFALLYSLALVLLILESSGKSTVRNLLKKHFRDTKTAIESLPQQPAPVLSQ